MESLEMDDLLDFASDLGDDDVKPTKPGYFSVLDPNDPGRPFPEFVEEELEWLSNKDAFPAIESFIDILPDHQSSVLKHQSPVSVLENFTTSSNNSNSTKTISTIVMSCCGSLNVPVRARSKSKRRLKRSHFGFPDLSVQQASSNKIIKGETSTIGRKCQHCGAEKTPQWRAGPHGPKTLCNACGVRYKSGRLVPEYRPASSPTFSTKLHSNSHRKVMEMRREKMMGMVVVVDKSVDKG